ncbi:MAG TPA: hypothetical protein ENN76_01870 [Euryarchaeota archaeon]|nr:hypothetical protein [Euryarchaeota archaeon]
MAEEEEQIYSEGKPVWFCIFGPIGSILIGQTTKGIVGIVAWLLLFWTVLGLAIWVIYLIDVLKIIQYWEKTKKPIGPWTFFWQLEE